jgi:hypothetical protein
MFLDHRIGAVIESSLTISSSGKDAPVAYTTVLFTK